MYLHVDLRADPATVTLEEPNDCGRLHVEVVQGTDPSAVAEVLVRGGVGHVDNEGHAFVSVVALRSLAEGRVDAAWPERFQRMIDYAGSRGWVSADQTTVQAHIEQVAW